MKPLIYLALLFGSLQSFASQNCTDYYQRQGAYSFQRQGFSDGTCFVSANPFVIEDMIYRSFLVSNEGLLMVFNSFDEFETANSHGARVFHFFPRTQNPDVFVSSDQKQSHMKLAAPGMEMILSQDEEKVLGLKGAKIKVSSKISRENQGGVEILSSKYLYLDSGFRMGQDPTSDPKRTSTFVDAKNQRCEVVNNEIFTYLSGGDVELKYSDRKLKDFLKARCPHLTLNF